MMRSMCAVVLAAVAGSAASAQVSVWTNASGGDWFTASNWSPMSVPDTAGESAVIATPGSYTVSIDEDLAFGSLTVDNLNAVVEIGNRRSVTVSSMEMSGRLRINPAQGSSVTTFSVTDGETGITGFGTIELYTRGGVVSGSTGQFSTPASVLTVPAGLEIRGSGTIINNTFSNTLRVTGSIRALPGFGSAPLAISNRYSTIDLTGGGELFADNWPLSYAGGTIIGGTLQQIGSGILDLQGTTTLDGAAVSLAGAFDVPNGRTINIQNGTTFPGAVRVNPNQGSGVTSFRLNDAATDLPTPLDLFTRADTVAGSTGQLVSAVNTLTIPAGSVVRGSGTITNNSVSGNTLVVEGEVRALPGFGASPLTITRYSTIDLTGGGELIADGWTLSYTGTVSGGTVRELNGGTLDFTGSTTLDAVAVDIPNPYEILNGRTLTLRSGTELPTGVRVNPAQGGSVTTLRIDDAVTPLPTMIELFTRADFDSASTGQLLFATNSTTVPAGTVLRGSGTITNTTLSGNTLVVDGLVQARPGYGQAALQIVRHDTVDLSGGGVLEADGWPLVVNSPLVVGGTVRATGGGTLGFGSNTTLDGVTVQQAAPLDIPNGSTLRLRGDNSLASGVRVNPQQGSSSTSLRIETGATLPPSIELFTRADALSGSTGQIVWTPGVATIPQGTVIEGSGTLLNENVSGNTLVNEGVLRAKPENGAAGLLVTNRYSLYRQTGTGTLGVFIDVGGDRSTFIDTADAELAGTLEVAMSEGYTPSFADVFEIIDERGTGEFDTLVPPAIDTDLVPFVFYRPDGVFFAYTCVVDENKDLVVNIFDILDFLNLWSVQGPGSDFNGDGSVNIFDILSFLTEWNMNCA